MKNQKVLTISVIGLGKLGGSMVACFAERGFDVIGVDINTDNVNAFNEGISPVQETGLNDLISKNKNKIRATTNYNYAIQNSEITFVIVPTPSENDGSFTLKYAKKAFEEIGESLKNKNSYHVVVMTSTVLPGSTRYALIPLLEEKSGKKCGIDFGVCYNPEFIALGSVINNFLNPDFYLLGEFDKNSGDLLEYVHNSVSLNDAPVKRMSIENAELAKIALNSYVTMKISFANILSEFCENIPNGNVDIVTDAIGMDKRIGRKYLTGGLGFAGPCFPRDNVALDFMGNSLGVDTELLNLNHRYNRKLSSRLASKIIDKIPKDSKIAILGLSYKALSHIIEESSGIALCKYFSEQGFKVKAHDNLALKEASSVLNLDIALLHDIDKVMEDANVILITTNDEMYKKLDFNKYIRKNENIIIVDYWRLFPQLKNKSGITYLPAGICLDDNYASNKLNKLWV